MAYQPVQRNAGEIMYNAAMRRAQTLGGALENWSNTLYQRQEENKAFNSKLKALEAMVQTHSTKFGMAPDQLKQFLAVNPNESPKERYLRIGGFFEGTLKAAELQKMQLANQKSQMEMDQLKKLGDIYSKFQTDEQERKKLEEQRARLGGGPAPAGAQQPSGKYTLLNAGAKDAAAAPGTSEMSLLNSLRRFAPEQDTGYGMVGAEPFRLPSQMAAPATAPVAPVAPVAPAAPVVPATAAAPAAVATSAPPKTPTEHPLWAEANNEFGKGNYQSALNKIAELESIYNKEYGFGSTKQLITDAAAKAGVKLGEVAPTETETEPKAVKASEPAPEGIPRPKIPSWYETLKTPMEIAAETAGAPGEMDLSPEAQAIARQLREQYEASLPVEKGKSAKQFISASDGRKGAQKGITLDAETLRAIIQDPRILMQLRAGRRVDGLIEDRQQLRALQEMMLPRRAR